MLRTSQDTAHFEIDPTRLDLAREFRHAPKGPHSPELRRVIHRMRWSGAGGRWCVVTVEPGVRWMLARLPDERFGEIRTYPETTFTSLNDAEWHVFRIRWEALTGNALPVEMD
ncbi:hypothetical protein [Ferrovibrio sp.]|uniref:hypothetical protein n=1 Tax=Ferrovibrio sp. TaxID=1917215 RepID=UPI0025B8EB62|nr:hypothetical protein [Ferrovibrio sp.]MBX3454189.1 hypothetical protein [Ferrovibrio sp.]